MAILIKKAPKFIINSATGGWLDAETVQGINMNSHAKKAIVKELKFRLRLPSPKRINYLNYFFIYKLDHNKQKTPATLYVRKSKKSNFVKITLEDMTVSGASPREYEEFLDKSLSSKVYNVREVIDKINL